MFMGFGAYVLRWSASACLATGLPVLGGFSGHSAFSFFHKESPTLVFVVGMFGLFVWFLAHMTIHIACFR